MSSTANTSTNTLTSGCPMHKLAKPDWVGKEDPHAFQHPTSSDIRGPCPALNALANHGYLPRDGRNITAQDLLRALQHRHTYRISAPLARVLVYGGLFLLNGLRFKYKPISLHDLALHNHIEHNASVVHPNTMEGQKYAPIHTDDVLLNNFLTHDSISIEHVSYRRVELEDASPLDALHQEIARGEWALVLDIFGKKSKESISKDFLHAWLKENRFAPNWMPTHRQGLFATVWRSSDIRRRMNSHRKQYMNSPEEKQEKTQIRQELSRLPM